MKNRKTTIRTLRVVAFLVAALLMSVSPVLSGMVDPRFRFSTIQTDHFVIHFHQGTDKIAAKLAQMSEEAHAKLCPAFQWWPTEKTQVVLIDDTDLANGGATVLPYNSIYVSVVPPLPDMTIGEYYDWIQLVILHEYAHILTMDPVRGYTSVMRSIFGRPLPGYDPLSLSLFLFAAPPNVFMPYWWLEGMATWAETEFSPAGRGRSSYYEMTFRMAVLEDRLPRVDQINGDVPYWPDGHMPYMYGLLMKKYIADKYGEETLGRLNMAHAGRVPFFISGPAQGLTGRNYAYLYGDTIAALREDQSHKIDHLQSMPLTEHTVIPLAGELLTNPRVSTTGTYLATNRRDPHHHEEIVILDRRTFREVARIRRLPSDHGISWSPDDRKIWFSQADLRGGFNLYQDIYEYDVADGTVRRVTRNMRAKDVDVSPDGRRAAFVKVGAAEQTLACLSLDGGQQVEEVAHLKDGAMSGPRWSPDGKLIAYSKRTSDGRTSLELYDTDASVIRTLLADSHDNVYPTWSPDGRYVLFTSDRTGVYNLYACALETQDVLRITHVLGGAFQADVSRDRIVFSGYNSKGYYIAEIPYDPSLWSRNNSPTIVPAWGRNGEEGSAVPTGGADSESARGTFISEKRDYSPLSTLLPRFWLPAVMFDDKGAAFGALTAGQDILGYHAYTVQAAYGISSRAYVDARYVYDRWYPSFSVKAFSLPYLYSEFFDDDADYYERQSGLTAQVAVPINFVESKYEFVAGYEWDKVEPISDVGGRRVGGLDVFEGRRNSLFLGMEYQGALKYPYSISREEGRNIVLLYRDYSDQLGSELSRRQYSADYEEFVGVGSHHVLYLNLRGAHACGDATAQQAFQLGGNSVGTTAYPLRGFPSGFERGDSIATGTAEYRFPIAYFLRGWGTKPFFWDRLHAAAFADAGNVWGDNKGFHGKDVSVGIGAEARLDMVLGYKIRLTPALGVARGVTGNGETQVYLTIYGGL